MIQKWLPTTSKRWSGPWTGRRRLFCQQQDDPDVPSGPHGRLPETCTACLGWAFQRGVGRPEKLYKRSCRVFTACAGAAIYRREVFETIGYFDEMHFAYLEDIDVGYRAKLYGYDNVFCPEAVVYHVGSGTSGSKYNSFKVKLAARNNVYLNYKNMRTWQLLLNSPCLLAGTFVKFLFF